MNFFFGSRLVVVDYLIVHYLVIRTYLSGTRLRLQWYLSEKYDQRDQQGDCSQLDQQRIQGQALRTAKSRQ